MQAMGPRVPVVSGYVRQLSPRARICVGSGLLAVVLLWLVAPTPTKLYDPKAHVSRDAKDLSDIQNSIVVPAYNEGPNMEPLVTRVFQSLPAEQVRHTEILVIDDNSKDDTSDAVEKLREAGYNVHLHVRKEERGLSSAVLHGFSLAQGSRLIVMDADLQHPPESVKDLITALPDASSVPGTIPPMFALGTRYGKGVSMDKDWPMYRRVISWGARVLSKPLTSAQDPMGGFFALRKELYLKSEPLNPSGFKIGLELLLKTHLASSQLVHVPYGFSKRQVGSSKLGAKVIIKYVGQLLALYHWRFGIFWYIFVWCAVAGALWVAFFAADQAVTYLNLQQTSVGRLVKGDKKHKRRNKSEV